MHNNDRAGWKNERSGFQLQKDEWMKELLLLKGKVAGLEAS